jgi:hypothetical protein
MVGVLQAPTRGVYLASGLPIISTVIISTCQVTQCRAHTHYPATPGLEPFGSIMCVECECGCDRDTARTSPASSCAYYGQKRVQMSEQDLYYILSACR